MLLSPALASYLTTFHQRDLHLAAAQARLSHQAVASTSDSVALPRQPRRTTPMSSLKSLAIIALSHPRAVAAATAAVALVASVLLGTGDASASYSVGGRGGR